MLGSITLNHRASMIATVADRSPPSRSHDSRCRRHFTSLGRERFTGSEEAAPSRRRLRRLLRTRQVSRRMHGADLSDRQFPDGLLRRGDEKRDAANFLSDYTGVRPTFPYSGLFSRVKPSSVPAPPGARSTGAGAARSALMRHRPATAISTMPAKTPGESAKRDAAIMAPPRP